MPKENRKRWEKFKKDNKKFGEIDGQVKQDLGPFLDDYDECFDQAQKQVKALEKTLMSAAGAKTGIEEALKAYAARIGKNRDEPTMSKQFETLRQLFEGQLEWVGKATKAIDNFDI